jgi:hypothetical protein
MTRTVGHAELVALAAAVVVGGLAAAALVGVVVG